MHPLLKSGTASLASSCENYSGKQDLKVFLLYLPTQFFYISTKAKDTIFFHCAWVLEWPEMPL